MQCDTLEDPIVRIPRIKTRPPDTMRNWRLFIRLGTAFATLVYVSFMGKFIVLPFTNHSVTEQPQSPRNEADPNKGNTSHQWGANTGRKSLNKILEAFASDLGPSAKMHRRVEAVISRIQKALHKHMRHRYSIDRIEPLGSYSKKTSIWFNMDLDVTVYIDDQLPPFGDFLRDLEEIIRRNLDSTCQKNSYLVEAQIDGLDVDIIPATNFVKRHVPGSQSKNIIQVRNALDYLKNKHGDYRNFSTALTSGAVEFEKRRSYYSRTLSRLAKVWSTLVGVRGFHYGRSSLMEYLGVYAAEQETSHDVLQGFRKFLKLIVHSDHLNVIWTMFYRREDVPSSILRQRPILLDPTNPRNNFLHGRTNLHLKIMTSYALTTLKRLEEAEKNTDMALMKIFEPQPKLKSLFTLKNKIPCDFLVEIRHTPEHLPTMETRRGAEGVNPRIIEDYLFTFTNVVAAAIREELRDTRHGLNKTTNDNHVARCEMTQRVVEEIRRVLFECPGSWTSTSRHEDREITFFVPVVQDSNEYIVVSFNWV